MASDDTQEYEMVEVQRWTGNTVRSTIAAAFLGLIVSLLAWNAFEARGITETIRQQGEAATLTQICVLSLPVESRQDAKQIAKCAEKNGLTNRPAIVVVPEETPDR